MALTFATSSIIPLESSVIPVLRDLAVRFATPLLLLDADVIDIYDKSGPFFLTFLCAALGTVFSSSLAWLVAGPGLLRALGNKDGAGLAAALLAKNIGGGVNFVAVAAACGVEPAAQAVALAVDNVMALVYFPAVSAFAGGQVTSVESQETAATASGLLRAVLAALVVLAVADRLALPTLPAATLLAVLFATVAPRNLRRSLAPAATVLADALLYVFFAAAGCAGGSVAACATAAAAPLFTFLIILYLGHVSFLAATAPLLLRRATKPHGNRPTLAIASNACIGGPATAAAMCTAKGWTHLVPASIAIGTFGYAIASFLGLFLHATLFTTPF